MKTLKITLAALSAFVIAGSALAQGHPGHAMPQHHMHGMHGMEKNDAMMKICMAGLSDSEKKTAMDMAHRMTPAQLAVMHKRMKMCMADKHRGMDMSKMDDKKGMAHVMSGLSAAEQKTLKGVFMSESPAEMAVTKKMMENCCMYGMKHGK